MTLREWSASTHSLQLARGTGLAAGSRVVVPSNDLLAETPGLLTVGREERAVRIQPDPGVSRACVVIGEQLADELGLAEGTPQPWALTIGAAAELSKVVLEPVADLSRDEAERHLRTAGDLLGQTFWLDGSGTSVWIDVEGVPFVVRNAVVAGGRPGAGLARIVRSTELELFLASAKSGVDVVILADCSGSMSWNDIEDHADVSMDRPTYQTHIRRIDALKRALLQMVEIRVHTQGRASRIALVKFTTSSRCVFPRTESMVEFNGEDDPNLAQRFREAVGLLQPEGAGTDIGQALHYASDLLYRHGRPENDRLVVLVSDGADWAPKGEEVTGESVLATSDPVSLMEEFHQTMGIRLHAIGISDRPTFTRWWNEYHRRQKGDPHPSVVPNHDLLDRLVTVGGGDPSRSGGVGVLEEYFSDLGDGVSHRIGWPAGVRLPPLQAELKVITSPRRHIPDETAAQRRELSEELPRLWSACQALARGCGAPPMFDQRGDVKRLLGLGREIDNEAKFYRWAQEANMVLREDLTYTLREQWPDGGYYPVTQVRDLLWGEGRHRLEQIEQLKDFSTQLEASPAAQQAATAILERHVARRYIEPDDAATWARLHVSLLADVVALLRDVKAAFEAQPVPSAHAAPVAVGTKFEGY